MSPSKYGKQMIGAIIATFLLSGCGSEFKITPPEDIAKDLVETKKIDAEEEQKRKQAELIAYVSYVSENTDDIQRSSDDARFIIGVDAGLIGTSDTSNSENQIYKTRVSFYLNQTGGNEGKLELINGEADIDAEAQEDGKFIDIPLTAQSEEFKDNLKTLIKEQGLKLQASCKNSCRELVLSINYNTSNSIKINPLYQFISDQGNALGLLKIDASSVADKFKYASQYYYENQAREINTADTSSLDPVFGYTAYFQQLGKQDTGLKANEFFRKIDLDLVSHGMNLNFENLGQLSIKLTIKPDKNTSDSETLEGQINLSWEDMLYTRKKSVTWSEESHKTKYKDIVFQVACYDRCNQVYVYSNTQGFNQVDRMVLARYQRNTNPSLSIMELIESTLKASCRRGYTGCDQTETTTDETTAEDVEVTIEEAWKTHSTEGSTTEDAETTGEGTAAAGGSSHRGGYLGATAEEEETPTEGTAAAGGSSHRGGYLGATAEEEASAEH